MTTNNNTINEEVKLERANRIAVQTVEGIYRADFYRTHKKIASIMSNETGWEMDSTMNKSAQREDFRRFIIEHAVEIGIDWKPQDLRTEENKRFPKYTDDATLKLDVELMLTGDIYELVAKCPHGIVFKEISADYITPVERSSKGTDLTKLGVIDGKYEKSGNWAWADVEVVVTLIKDNEEIYYNTKVQLVSGQLKKPHITQTGFNEEVKISLIEAGLYKEEVKAEKSAKTKSEEVVPVEVNEEVEVVEESKPKKRGRKSKKESEEE